MKTFETTPETISVTPEELLSGAINRKLPALNDNFNSKIQIRCADADRAKAVHGKIFSGTGICQRYSVTFVEDSEGYLFTIKK